MPATSKFIGDTVDIPAYGSGTIKLRTERPAKIIRLSFKSTGRCQITKFEQLEVVDYLSGKIEVDNLVSNGKVFELTQPWDWAMGVDIVIGLSDLSGEDNTVTVMFETIPA